MGQRYEPVIHIFRRKNFASSALRHAYEIKTWGKDVNYFSLCYFFILDIYAQVFGKDRPGRIRGVGTGIHPKKVMIYPTCSTHSHLRDENVRLTQEMKVLADKIKDVELLVRERNANQAPSSSKCVASSVSVMEPTSVKLQGKNVKMLNMDGEEVGIGVVMSEENEKMVMGRFLGDAYCEIFVTFATKADAALFVKDVERTKMKDAVGSHIIWFKDYIQVDRHP